MTVNIVGIMTGLGATQLTPSSRREPPKRRRLPRGARRRTSKGHSENAKADTPDFATNASRGDACDHPLARLSDSLSRSQRRGRNWLRWGKQERQVVPFHDKLRH